MEKQPVARDCFICGWNNEISMKADYYNDVEAGQVFTEVTIPSYGDGWPGIAHGGIVAALLDETSYRSIWLDGNYQRVMATAEMDVRFLRPTPTGQTLKAVGWTVEMDDVQAQVIAEIRLLDGTVTARCKGLLLKPSEAFLEKCNYEAEISVWKVRED
ncbi:MAG: PaaI family thioesterase [Syntrophomonadaceae bacterium]|nr:PaaI family thioesterase [Syntrophomonadaceae bacterium]